MPLVSLSAVLLPAYRGHFAIGSFNTFNEDFTDAILAAAASEKSPVIVSFSEVQLSYVDLECIAEVTRIKARRLDIPVVLHLDHGLTLETVSRAVDLGFTSVMFDGSAMPYEENVRNCRAVVQMCAGREISVEAELGAVGGDEGGGAESEADTSLFTDVSLATDFVKQTGVDALAVAIGNAHGRYKREPQLDFNRLGELNDALEMPLVLHGGSGISDADFRMAIDRGIAKINFYTGMLQAAITTTKSRVGECGERYSGYLDLLKQVKDRVASTVAERIRVFRNGK